ncbi:MAG TPA: hypothetical protein VGR16_14615 [Thermomicrobiales bacterium]|nr:hypothetical protein [Thermomicrobiales bacterium]
MSIEARQPGEDAPRGGGSAEQSYGGVDTVNQPAFGQGIIVSIIVAGLVFAMAIAAVGRGSDDRGGIPATETAGWLYWSVSILIIIGAALGAQYAERVAAGAAAAVGQSRPQSVLPTAWAVPAVSTFGALLLIATYHNSWMLLLGPLIAFLGTAGALFSRDLLDDAGEAAHRMATTVHTTVIHAAAFLAFGTIYLNKFPDWFGAMLAGLVATALVLEMLERAPVLPPIHLLYALLAGLVLWQATLAVNWWPTHGWTGGAVLLVVFYLIGGVLLTRAQRDRFRTRDLLEYGLVSLVAIVFLAATS